MTLMTKSYQKNFDSSRNAQVIEKQLPVDGSQTESFATLPVLTQKSTQMFLLSESAETQNENSKSKKDTHYYNAVHVLR